MEEPVQPEGEQPEQVGTAMEGVGEEAAKITIAQKEEEVVEVVEVMEEVEEVPVPAPEEQGEEVASVEEVKHEMEGEAQDGEAPPSEEVIGWAVDVGEEKAANGEEVVTSQTIEEGTAADDNGNDAASEEGEIEGEKPKTYEKGTEVFVGGKLSSIMQLFYSFIRVNSSTSLPPNRCEERSS